MADSGEWTCWRLVFRAESPIHIGWHDLGLIQRTRYYIPARSIWGALVAGLAPRMYRDRKDEAIYAEARVHVAKTLRVSYFFPARHPTAEPLRPRYDDGGLRYGGLTPGQFERAYIGSQTSTALDAERLSAERGALHESEFIVSFDSNGNALYFTGYAFVRHPAEPEQIWEALTRCAVGADRRYGWGRLRLYGEAERANEAFGFAVSTRDQGQLRLISGSDREWCIPAHVLHETSADAFEGELEAVAGRDWAISQGTRGGSGQNVTRASLCWVPGSRPNAAGDRHFDLEPEGFWKLIR